jgi:hypothetical protein
MFLNQNAGNLRRLARERAQSNLWDSAPKEVVLGGFPCRDNVYGDEVVFICKAIPIALRNLGGVERRNVLVIYQFFVVPQKDISKWGVVLSLARESVTIEVRNNQHRFVDTFEPLLG